MKELEAWLEANLAMGFDDLAFSVLVGLLAAAVIVWIIR